MKITFLGTSAGKPTKNRNVSAIVLEKENGWYLFDCGEATQHQLLKTKYSLHKLKSIFITHLHGDHIFGLFGLITSKMMEKSSTPLKIYSPQGLKDIIEKVIDITSEHLGYEIEFIEIYGGFEEEFENFKIKTLPLIHSKESYAYYIVEKERFKLNENIKSTPLPPTLYKKIKENKDIEFKGKIYKAKDYLTPLKTHKIIIAGDNAEPNYLGEYLNNLDLLIHEATYTQEVFEKLKTKYLHTTAKELGITAQKYNIKNLIATHISPRFEGWEIYEEIKKYFSKNLFVANDFDSFELKNGNLVKL